MKIWTIGHGTKPLALFLEKLRGSGIEAVIDARSFPRSRFNPQYNQKALTASLAAEGIHYLWMGDRIGGRGPIHDTDAAIDEIAALAHSKRVALLCSESDYHECHRHTVLEPLLVDKGARIEHILYTA